MNLCKNEKGYTLFIAIALLMLVSFLAFTALSISTTDFIRSHHRLTMTTAEKNAILVTDQLLHQWTNALEKEIQENDTAPLNKVIPAFIHDESSRWESDEGKAQILPSVSNITPYPNRFEIIIQAEGYGSNEESVVFERIFDIGLPYYPSIFDYVVGAMDGHIQLHGPIQFIEKSKFLSTHSLIVSPYVNSTSPFRDQLTFQRTHLPNIEKVSLYSKKQPMQQKSKPSTFTIEEKHLKSFNHTFYSSFSPPSLFSFEEARKKAKTIKETRIFEYRDEESTYYNCQDSRFNCSTPNLISTYHDVMLQNETFIPFASPYATGSLVIGQKDTTSTNHLYLNGDIWIEGDLIIQNTTIHISPFTRIFVTGDVKIENSSFSAHPFLLMSKGDLSLTTIQNKKETQTYSIYALLYSEKQLTLNHSQSNLHFYGSLIGKDVLIHSHSNHKEQRLFIAPKPSILRDYMKQFAIEQHYTITLPPTITTYPIRQTTFKKANQ